jgi:hypothetical protein
VFHSSGKEQRKVPLWGKDGANGSSSSWPRSMAGWSSTSVVGLGRARFDESAEDDEEEEAEAATATGAVEGN